jgi:hypothetical protein
MGAVVSRVRFGTAKAAGVSILGLPPTTGTPFVTV